MAARQSCQCGEGRHRQNTQESKPVEAINFSQILQGVLLHDKIRKLMPFLLRKYQKKEQITMEEMLHTVGRDYRGEFPAIFREFCESVSLGFGIDIRKSDPFGYRYKLVPVLGLTYSGLLDDDNQIVPKVDILIFILSLIFLNGNRISEEELKTKLERWEMLARIENICFKNPWKFITEDLVWAQYVEYRQIPNSDPVRYEFLWGPRAHAETTKMKMLEHMAKLNSEDPRAYPELYEEALTEERGAVRVPEGQKK
ncbi:PREDICTED: melanoma-associated antigen 10-like [Chinchilla lanigera]|uniref:melanoma-associated antigen 10-like n=1 Tax=Chinchilla lanigera TaxID=34839 RepID=UPI00038EE72F|nr:PREDICTED: melanoma-associated antigen 10-like [Chinchilla lanigera]